MQLPGHAQVRTRNCSFIACRRAPPQALRAWHFLCWALATCFLISQLHGELAASPIMAPQKEEVETKPL